MIKNSNLSDSFSEICRWCECRSESWANGLMRAVESAENDLALVVTDGSRIRYLSELLSTAQSGSYDQSRVVPQDFPVPEFQGLFVFRRHYEETFGAMARLC